MLNTALNTNAALIAHDLFVMNQNNTKYFYFKMYTGYKVHRLCAQSGLRVLMNLADSLFLPYNLKRFPEQMKKSLEKLTNKNEIMEVSSLLKKLKPNKYSWVKKNIVAFC